VHLRVTNLHPYPKELMGGLGMDFRPARKVIFFCQLNPSLVRKMLRIVQSSVEENKAGPSQRSLRATTSSEFLKQ